MILDFEYLIGNKNNIVYNPNEVFGIKKIICLGYAWLFSSLSKCMGYQNTKIKKIQGHSKGMIYCPEELIDDFDAFHE